jgi:hypothetical protein
VKEPVSVITEAARIVAGVAIIAHGGVMAWYVGVTMIFLGLASAWFHWTLAWDPQTMDERGMYLCFWALIAATWAPFLEGVGPYFAAFTVFMGVCFAVYARRISSTRAVPSLCAAMLVGVGLSVGWATAGWLALAFAATLAIRQTHDWSPALMPYKDLIHGVWHLSTALFMFIAADIIL